MKMIEIKKMKNDRMRKFHLARIQSLVKMGFDICEYSDHADVEISMRRCSKGYAQEVVWCPGEGMSARIYVFNGSTVADKYDTFEEAIEAVK